MKISLLVAGLVPLALAITHSGRGFLSVPVGTAPHNDLSAPTRRDEEWTRLLRHARRNFRRTDSESGDDDNDVVDTDLSNEDFYYTTTIGLGTPPQKVALVLDTGSSELWVNPDCSTAPSESERRQCRLAGKYDPGGSSTPPIGPFGGANITFGDPTAPSTQSAVRIVYYTDVLTVEGDGEDPTVTNQTFGVVTASAMLSSGIMGLGPDLREGFTPGKPYSFVLNSLAEQGVIASRVFSLDLRHQSDKEGSLVYGGLDKNRFTGDLVPRPFVRGLDNEYRLAVDLTAVGVVNDGQTTNLTVSSAPALLDSGTTISRLSPGLVEQIASALGARRAGGGYYYVDCSKRSSDATVDFVFGTARISVSLSDFVLKVYADTVGHLCYVGMTATQGMMILGDSVLRAGYFVFDWDNQQVHIAQAASCGEGEDIVSAGAGDDSVPPTTGNCVWGEHLASGSNARMAASGWGAVMLVLAFAFALVDVV